MKNISLFIIFFLSFAANIFSQNYNMTAALTNVSACGGFFNDSGGTTGFYQPNQNFTTTICSNGSGGTHVRLTFQNITLGAGDLLCFYDGPTTASPLINCSDQLPNQIIIQASATNVSGCITVTFQSDATEEAAGWVADISCVAACQIFQAIVTSTTPAIMPADTGWIDVCPRKNIFFSGKGVYPQNNQVYRQSDSTSIFEWTFGDGTPNRFGPTVNHIYAEAGGYFASLKITDKFGCTNTNYVRQRVRVSTKPTFNLGQIPNNICQGDTISLEAVVNDTTGTGSVFVAATEGSFSIGAVRSDSLALPDGDGSSYTTSIKFSDFGPGQLLTNINDLNSICVNMEHSWLRDLEISITCPSGQKVILHNHAGQMGSELYLGEPIDNDGLNPTPGIGYTYCWTVNPPNGTWLQWGNGNPGAQTLPAGDYKSFQPLTNLVGCPLNGDWTITVKDLWASDNGYIFNWSVNFKQSLYPNIEKFKPTLVTHQWINNPSIFFNQNDSIRAVLQYAGTSGYTYSVKDNFGCTYDTSFNITVLPPTHPQCYKCNDLIKPLRDTSLCGSSAVLLDATFSGALSQNVPFAAFPFFKFGFANAPPANPYISPIAVSSVSPALLTDSLQIESVCLDINTDYDNDLQIFLQAPSGQLLELTTNNGGGGDNYTNTCFKPTATVAINSGSAPFTGTFKPEGKWSSLVGAAINGQWKLKLGDGFGPNNFGLIKSWIITFKTTNNVTYTWSPNTAISCTNCPTPSVTPMQTTDYALVTNDNYGCIHRDTAKVSIVSQFAAPQITCNPITQAGQITFSWQDVPGSTAFEVNVNSTGWVSPNGVGLNHIVTGLSAADIVTIQVRVAASQSLCSAAIGSTSCTYFFCPLQAILSETTLPTCANTTDGTATIVANNGIGGTTFFIDGQPNGTNLIFSNLSGGAHVIVTKDGSGCTDTLAFLLPTPSPIALNINIIDSIPCFGQTNAKLFALASGGTGALSYDWTNNGATTSDLSNVGVGTYIISVKDAKNCEIKDTVVVVQPPLLQLALQQDSAKCFGDRNGKITTQTSGGIASYQYIWSNGETTAVLDSVVAGKYSVTITDSRNCFVIDSAVVSQPAPILFAKDSTSVACNGGSNGVASVFPNGGVSPYSYLWSDPLQQNTPIATGLGAGVYQCRITDSRNCRVTANIIINENSTMSLSPIGKPTKCSYSADGQATVNIMSGIQPFTFKWSDAAAQTNNTAVGLVAGIYFVTVTDALGCEKISQVSVDAPPALLSQFSITNPLCNGSSDGTARVNIANGVGTLAYQWNDPFTQSTQTATGLPAGTYAVTVQDANGCQIADSLTLLTPPALKTDSTRQTTARCFGDTNGAAEIFMQGGTPPYSYQWNDPLGQIQNPAVQLASGNYAVTVVDKNGCKKIDLITVLQPSLLTSSTTFVPVRCLGGNDGTATVVVAGGSPPYQYKWANNQQTPTATGLSAGSSIVTITDKNGCVSLDSALVSQPITSVTVDVIQTKLACFGGAGGEVQATATGGNGANYSYLWSDFSTFSLNKTVTAGFYTVTATDASGCKSADTITVKELAEIKILSILKTPPTCFGGSDGKLGINIVVGGAGDSDLDNYTYLWSVAGSLDTTIVSNLLGGQNYALTITDAQGCQGNATLFLDQPPRIEFNTTTTQTLCFGGRDGTAVVKDVTGGTPNYQYEWDAAANNQTTATAKNLASGTYRVTITDLIGCKTDTSLVIGQPEELKIGKIKATSGLCAGDTLGTAIATPTGGTGSYSYSWSNGDTTPTADNLKAGIYQLIVTDENKCTAVAATQIIPIIALKAAVATENISCFGERDGQISIIPDGGNPPYYFSLNGTNYNGASVIPGLKSGKYTVYVRDANGCFAVTSAELTQPDTFRVNAGLDQTINFGDSTQLLATIKNNSGNVTFTWSAPYNGILSCEKCLSPFAKPPYTVDFRLVATDQKGCTASDYVRIIVLKNARIAVPTAFSPNGDFENDLLGVFGRAGTTATKFSVFDRWGTQLYTAENFSVNDLTVGWDGTFRSQLAPDGIYVWFVEVVYADGTKELLKGETTLIR